TKLQAAFSVTHHTPPDGVLVSLFLCRRLLSLAQASAFNAPFPAYFACLPSCCSMRSSWLYLAVRSERASEPVLIWPQFVATARSAMVESSVSPERCDITAV